MTGPLTEQQRAAVSQASETAGRTALAIAAAIPGVDCEDREEVYEAAYARVKDHLAGVLDVLSELLAATAEDTRIVGQVRGVLAMDDGEDPRYVLKVIERIVGGER